MLIIQCLCYLWPFIFIFVYLVRRIVKAETPISSVLADMVHGVLPVRAGQGKRQAVHPDLESTVKMVDIAEGSKVHFRPSFLFQLASVPFSAILRDVRESVFKGQVAEVLIQVRRLAHACRGVGEDLTDRWRR
jgi:hypothetical protein